ncbi:MAG: oxidative damage protection protein [Solibacterales bacterium]|nr:oxidative damage protection protein [Bryobacterales bacterium]|tara:strand:+ start:57369 stop:57647 length:279 start_codon:yes stop_codon:yes gene_type:complete
MAERMVQCAKLGKELPGLDELPFENELGQRVFNSISQQAWEMWAEHLKMVINEYRLNPGTMEAQDLILKQMEQFFFGDGTQLPPDYVPPEQG